MNEIEQMFERIRNYHAEPKPKKRRSGNKPNWRKQMIIKSQRKKFKSNE